MKKQTILIATLILAIAGVGGYALSKTEFFDSIKNRHRGEEHKMTESTEVKETVTSDMHGIQGAEVLTEKEFIAHMIPHHQEAVDSAMEVLARGENAEVRALAEAIVTGQEKEITDMKTWHQAWFKEAYKADGSYQPMMRDLSTLSGKDLDRAFIQDMIEHHMSALTMIHQVAPKIEHAEIHTLITNIAENQSNELITMRILENQL
jgi:uncharacterized protein (DUF305 family)